MFYDSPHDSRKSIVARKNVLCVMAEICQFHVSNVCDLNMHEAKELNASAKEHEPKANHKNDEQNEVILGTKLGD